MRCILFGNPAFLYLGSVALRHQISLALPFRRCLYLFNLPQPYIALRNNCGLPSKQSHRNSTTKTKKRSLRYRS